ncbi:hypothetical protein ACWC0C_45140 [Streptomyces sp. NPDC001709]
MKRSSASQPCSTRPPSPSCAISPTPASTPPATPSSSPADRCLPLDNATWTALQRCLDHRSRLQTDNPHLLVTRLTRTTRAPAGAAHIRDSLAPAGLLPRILRSTRLVTLAEELDIKVLTASLGMSYTGVSHYHNTPHIPVT